MLLIPLRHLRGKFVEWYSNELMKHFNDVDDSDDIELQAVDLSSANLREIGALWFVEAANYISDTPSLIVNGFHYSGIAAAIDDAYGYLHEPPDASIENVEDYYFTD